MKDNEIIEEAIRLAREGVRVTFPVKGAEHAAVYHRWHLEK